MWGFVFEEGVEDCCVLVCFVGEVVGGESNFGGWF